VASPGKKDCFLPWRYGEALLLMQDAANTVEAERCFSSIEEIVHEPDLTIRACSQQRPRMPGDGDNDLARMGPLTARAHGLPGTSTPA
jgi:hypothetical protein